MFTSVRFRNRSGKADMYNPKPLCKDYEQTTEH